MRAGAPRPPPGTHLASQACVAVADSIDLCSRPPATSPASLRGSDHYQSAWGISTLTRSEGPHLPHPFPLSRRWDQLSMLQLKRELLMRQLHVERTLRRTAVCREREEDLECLKKLIGRRSRKESAAAAWRRGMFLLWHRQGYPAGEGWLGWLAE